jgi:hypothetical protein
MRPNFEEEKFEDLIWIQIEVEGVPGRKGGTSKAPWDTPGCGSAR